jgi:hypothetical protein
MAMFSNNLGAKKGEKGQYEFYCELCDYVCCSKYKIERHNMTSKHIQAMNSNGIAIEKGQKGQKGQKEPEYVCQNCNKKYKDNSGLWRHKKKCKLTKESGSEEEEKEKSNEPSDKDLIMLLIKENSEFKNMMMKVLENGTHNTTTHTNSHNKAFNLQFFLNETCKDAMNITDFVDSIKLQLSDLERVGELGYVEGISNIIVKNLKDLDVTQRPVHCTDKKRETLYIKDEDKWEKDAEKKKMHKLVKKVADKNVRMLHKFKEAHPDCNRSVSKFSDQYNKIIVESMGGPGDNDYEKEEKIIKKVSNEVFVEKE